MGMNNRERRLVALRLLGFWHEEVGDTPINALTDYGAWLKEGFTEEQLREAITTAASNEALRESEHVHAAVKQALRRARRARSDNQHAA